MKSKISVQHLFCSSCYRSSEWSHQASSGNHMQHLSIWAHSSVLCLWAFVFYLHLFYASVSDMCPKVMVSSLYTILTSEGFIVMLSFWLVEGNQYLYTNPKAKSYCLASKKSPFNCWSASRIRTLVYQICHFCERRSCKSEESPRGHLLCSPSAWKASLTHLWKCPPSSRFSSSTISSGMLFWCFPLQASMLLPHIAVGGVHSDHGGHLCMPVPCVGAPGRKEAYFPHLSSLRSSQLSLVHGNSQAVLWVREVWSFGMI